MRPGFLQIPFAMGALLALGPGSGSRAVAGRSTMIFPMPVLVSANIVIKGCESQLPEVTTVGSAELPGLEMGLFFSSHEAASQAGAMGLDGYHPVGEEPASGGGNASLINPFLWMQFVDGAGNPLGKQVFLGHCAESGFRVRSVLILPIATDPQRGVTRASFRRAPDLSAGGPTALETGLSVKLTFWTVQNPHELSGPLAHPASIEIKLLEPGAAFRIPKQPVAPSPHLNQQRLASFPRAATWIWPRSAIRRDLASNHDSNKKKAGSEDPAPLSPAALTS